MQLVHSSSIRFASLQILLLFELLVIRSCDGANILLYIGGLSSHSHQYGVEPLMNKLADRGHNVTILSPQKRKVNHPKIHYFCPSELAEYHKGQVFEFGILGLKARSEEKYSVKLLKTPSDLFDPCFLQNEAAVKSTEFKKWSESTSFDLIIIDSTCNEGAYGLVHKYDAKSILFTPIGSVFFFHFDVFGIPPESSWLPSLNNNYEGEMGLLDRIFNAFTTLHWSTFYEWEYLTRMEKLLRDEFISDKPMPKLVDMLRNTSLMLANQHFSDQFAKSYPPFVVPVGGIHLDESTKKLDPELENFILEGKDGFMYMSFGSIINISTISPKLLQVFFETLESFKSLRFLWKWEGSVPESAPKNILFKPWFSQNDVLAHSKIRGMIFQGGQVSMQQAIFHSVPLIVFPVNGDQDLNAKRIRYTKNGIEMELYDLSVSDLTTAITTLLTDKSYTAISKHLSKLTRDRPMHPLDTAVWWTEFVLRHDDLSQLKPVAIHQPWWKQRLIDVWATVFLGLILIIGFAILKIKFCWYVYCFLRGSNFKANPSRNAKMFKSS